MNRQIEDCPIDSKNLSQLDFYYNANTDEMSEYFDDSDLDAYVDNLNDWD